MCWQRKWMPVTQESKTRTKPCTNGKEVCRMWRWCAGAGPTHNDSDQQQKVAADLTHHTSLGSIHHSCFNTQPILSLDHPGHTIVKPQSPIGCREPYRPLSWSHWNATPNMCRLINTGWITVSDDGWDHDLHINQSSYNHDGRLRARAACAHT